MKKHNRLRSFGVYGSFQLFAFLLLSFVGWMYFSKRNCIAALDVGVFGFDGSLPSQGAVVCKGSKANKTGQEPAGCLETHGFVEKETGCKNGYHSTQTVERRVVQDCQLAEHVRRSQTGQQERAMSQVRKCNQRNRIIQSINHTAPNQII